VNPRAPHDTASNQLCTLLQIQRPTEIVDIGASPFGTEPPYKAMLDAGLCHITGFEPHEGAFNQLQQTQGANERYLPYAIGDGGHHTLNVYSGPLMTSLYEVDVETVDVFPEFIPWTQQLRKIELSTHKLDDIAEVEAVDYLKIDIQGGELEVFRSGRAKLAQTVVIQTEISFTNLYVSRPSFGEIDLELRQQGFIPHRFAEVKTWPIAPHVLENNPWATANQLLEADVVYVRDFIHPQSLSNEQLKQLALIAHYAYKSFDLALRCVMLLERRGAVQLGAQQAYRSLVV
jgi:FkbM family methyltransferase